MAPLQSLKQSLGAVIGAQQLKVVDIQARVRGRYPEATPLPNRPELDRLLEEAGAPIAWNPTAGDGRGAYCLDTLGRAQNAGTSTQYSRHATQHTAHGWADDDTAQAAAAENRLVSSLSQGGMLVVTVDPRIAKHAEHELLHRFGQGHTAQSATQPLTRIKFDALLLSALREQAQAAGIDWQVVLQADAAERTSRHWTNLQRLVQRTLPTLRQALLYSPTPILLTSAGLLARYQLMGLVSELEEAAGRPQCTPSAWLLLPTSQQGLPVMDGVAIPMVNNINTSRALALPKAWIENKHRAKNAAQGRVAL
jgi:hypothetical protein